MAMIGSTLCTVVRLAPKRARVSPTEKPAHRPKEDSPSVYQERPLDARMGERIFRDTRCVCRPMAKLTIPVMPVARITNV